LKQSTLRLVVVVSALYFFILFLARGLFPSGFTLPFYFLAAPLLLVVLVLVSDLTGRATVPTETPLKAVRGRTLSRRVQELARQIEVGATSSRSYYDSILLARLQALLVEKVSLETGMDKKRVQEILKNETLGPGLLRSQELYRLLYSGAPARGPGRVKLLEEAVAEIEAWKP